MDSRRGHCQVRVRFLAAALSLSALLGCGRTEVPDYDSLTSQVLRDAYDAIAGQNAEQTAARAERLREVLPGDPLAPALETWLAEQRALAAVNSALQEGRPELARERLTSLTGEAFRATLALEPTVEALRALEAYLRRRPFPYVREAEEALAQLTPHLDLLRQSPALVAFLEEEAREADRLRSRQAASLRSILLREIDVAAVTGVPDVTWRLTLLEASAPDHPVVGALAATCGTDPQALQELLDRAGRDSAEREGLEIALCLARDQVAPETWRLAVPVLLREAPVSLSGMLLRTAALAEQGSRAEALACLRQLVATAPPARQHLEHLLATQLLPPHQVNAWCWRSPCPGVPELLTRIAQLRSRAKTP
ncbi:MAG: hypothetical protein JXR77_17840 [Lentisphaeria bacterium]|nr:hypothetical protein [Lentisphaeria bacterium]